MLLTENIRQAFTSLKANKNRTILTMIGIVIGLSSVLTIVSLGDTVSSLAENLFVQYITEGNILYIFSGYDETEEEFSEGDYNFSREEIYDFIESSNGVILDVNEYFSSNTTGDIKIDDEHGADVSVVGVSSAYDKTKKLRLLSGRFVTRDECRYAKPSAVISDEAAVKSFGSVEAAIGQTIDFQGSYTDEYYDEELNEYVETSPLKIGAEFVVVGVYEYVEPSAMLSGIRQGDTTPVYCPASYYMQNVLMSEYTEESWVWQFAIKDSESVPVAESMIREFAEEKYGEDYPYMILNFMNDLKIVTNIISVITVAFVVIAAIALLVGGIGLMNTMLVSVTERTKEIGIKKALGARNSAIRTQFLIESASLCLVACGIGVFFGMLTGMIIESNLGRIAALIPEKELQYFILNNEIHVTPSLNAIIICTLFSLAVGVIFGLYPANKGAKMQPVDALRYE